MITQRKNAAHEEVYIALNDLVRINNERIACYDQVRTLILNTRFENLFNDIIAEGKRFNEKLSIEINGLSSTSKTGKYVPGSIHRAWQDLRIAFTGKTPNALLSYCEYTEELAQLAYGAALNVSGETSRSCAAIIEEQWHSLKQILSKLKQSHEVRTYAVRPAHAYFN